jgi:hypothetical protein
MSSNLLSNWFQRKRFLCEFPIGFYVKLSSAVGAILVEGPSRQTHLWKRTIQWLFHHHMANCNQTLVEWSLDGPLLKMCLVILISNQDGHQAKNRKKGGWNLRFGCGGHLGRRAEPPDTFVEENHPMTISSKFSFEQMVSDKKIFMAISHRVLC